MINDRFCQNCRHSEKNSNEEPCVNCINDIEKPFWEAREEEEQEEKIPAESLEETSEKRTDAFLDALAGMMRYKTEQTAKADAGKLQIHLVPTQIIRDIAEIRMYGTAKYGDPDNWKQVSPERYRDALARHFLAYMDDPGSIDDESGKKHLKHMACNIAFLCAMENKEEGGPM